MKNIYILPTEEPSRLHYSNGQISYKLVLKKEFSKCNDGLLSGQRHIYITSDEEIEEGDWVYSEQYKNRLLFKLPNSKYFYKKIILTTDRDLIKDGVQAINDEFLEWFVKNPSCEFINVDEKTPDEIEVELNIHGHDIGLTDREFDEWVNNGGQLYKIIIPKEEAKVNNLIKLFGKDFDLESSNTIKNCNVSFEEGAKWQQEQMYSEEDLRQAFRDGQENINYSETYGLDSKLTEHEWFEQFKKK